MTELTLDLEGHSELLQKKSLKDEVFELLHQRIVAGKYAAGEWLRQEDISSQLGVSQTPVREALDLLVSVGLAERVPYRGVRVPELTHAEILEAYTMRMLLETAAARLAARHASQVQLEALVETVERTRNLLTLDELSDLRQLNRRFHQSIALASGNELLAQLYDLTANRFPDWQLYEYLFRHPELLQSSLEQEYHQHRRVVDALAARDPAMAERRIAEHIRALGRELVEYLGIPENLVRNGEKNNREQTRRKKNKMNPRSSAKEREGKRTK